MFATRFQEYSRRLKNEDLEEGATEGLDQGRTEGRDTERLAIARRLLERAQTVETGLRQGAIAPCIPFFPKKWLNSSMAKRPGQRGP